MTRYLGTHFGTYEVRQDPDGPRLVPFRDDPAPSAIGPGLIELADHPSRIATPAVRASWLHGRRRSGRGSDTYIAVSWDQALDLTAAELRRVREQVGNQAIYAGSYGWASAGRFHHAQSQLKRLLNLLGGFVSSVNSYSYAAAAVLLPHLLGPAYRDAGVTAVRWDDVAQSCDLMLAFGGFRHGNAEVESGGSGQHLVPGWLTRGVARGMRLVVLSPSRRDIPPGLQAEHAFIRPNTDTAVLLAMAQVLLAEGLEDRAFLARCTIGADQLGAYLLGHADGIAKTPEWAETISGLAAATIRDLARRYAGSRGLAALAWSLQRARFGEQPYAAAIALACLAGHAGKPGCGFAFGLGSTNAAGRPAARLVGPAVPQGQNPVRDFIPVARLADMLLHPGEPYDFDGETRRYPHARLVWWAGGNPFHHHQDINRLRTALARPDCIIVHESHWNAMARHADIVLPTTLPSERNDIAVSSRDCWMFANHRILQPAFQARSDHDICTGIAARFGLELEFTEGRDEMGWIAHLYDGFRTRHQEMPDFPTFWEQGVFHLDTPAPPTTPQHALEQFAADPAAHPLATPSGKIELFSATIASFGYPDCPAHAAWLEPEEYLGAPAALRFPIHLLSPQPEGKLHSQLDAAAASAAAKRNGRAIVLLHPDDAAARGIADGDVVRLFNDRGACLAVAEPTADLMQGVAVLPTGAWYDPLDPADPHSLDKHGNPNLLTSDIGTSALGQGPAPNSCLIDIARFDRHAPAVTAFQPPIIITDATC